MFDLISISELQKSGKKAFTSDKFAQIVLSGSEKSGLIFSKEVLELFEETGLLEEIEDRLLGHHMSKTLDSDDSVSLKTIKDALRVS